MNLNLANDIFNNLKENKFVQNFMKELSNYLENNLNKSSRLPNNNCIWNNLNSENLTIDNTKIITKIKNEMLTERNNILQNYAKDTTEKGEMYYIYGMSTNKNNSYNLCICEESKSHEVITKAMGELPKGATLGSVLRKQDDNFILDTEATKTIEKQIDNMIQEKIKEQKEYLDSKRIDGHIYEVGEKYSGRIWLYDSNNLIGGGIEGIEEIEFPENLYKTAKIGDLFIYENGMYERYLEK